VQAAWIIAVRFHYVHTSQMAAQITFRFLFKFH